MTTVLISSVNLCQSPMEKALLLSPFNGWGNSGLGRLSDMPVFTQLSRGGAGIQTQVGWLQSLTHTSVVLSLLHLGECQWASQRPRGSLSSFSEKAGKFRLLTLPLSAPESM